MIALITSLTSARAIGLHKHPIFKPFEMVLGKPGMVSLSTLILVSHKNGGILIVHLSV